MVRSRRLHIIHLKKIFNKTKYNEDNMNINDFDCDIFGDVELSFDDLEKYFIKTIQIAYKQEGTIFDEDCRWTNFYINPPCGVTIKVNETLFSFDCQKIEKLLIYENESGSKTISCFDNEDKWVEDVDIVTSEHLNNIKFIFEGSDLKACSTTDVEQQLYVELSENVGPYQSVEENRKSLHEFIKKYSKIHDIDIQMSDNEGGDDNG